MWTHIESQMQSQPGDILPKVKKEQGGSDNSANPKMKKKYDCSNYYGSPGHFDRTPYDSASPKMKKKYDCSNYYGYPGHFDRTPQKPVGTVPFEENDQDAQYIENASNQLVVYNPGMSDTSQVLPMSDPTEYQILPVPAPIEYQILPVPAPIEYQIPTFPSFSAPNPGTRVLPTVGAFTVQCATCFKWRFVPTKEKYEKLRENILQEPFVCATAREWRPDISCDDPADISQDGSRLWAIDKPNISQPPPGWQRLLTIRGEGGTRFADVYYVTPSGKKLRSLVEIQRYLFENPEYIREGVCMSQFSFKIPKPLQENYVRKRPYTPRVTQQYDGSSLGMPRPLSIEPAEVNPLSWACPVKCPKLQKGRSDRYYEELKAPVFHPLTPVTKKRSIRRRSKHMYSGSSYILPHIKIEEPQHSRNSAYKL
ncbi:uncharacterized protein LOC143867583 [Tasmannia lanceolata]|uniref:uncharacterized protein LOC143867220 n=1 Tax=Tasmannia lanceolata TaxID=3420 RepID=UPI004064287A